MKDNCSAFVSIAGFAPLCHERGGDCCVQSACALTWQSQVALVGKSALLLVRKAKQQLPVFSGPPGAAQVQPVWWRPGLREVPAGGLRPGFP